MVTNATPTAPRTGAKRNTRWLSGSGSIRWAIGSGYRSGSRSALNARAIALSLAALSTYAYPAARRHRARRVGGANQTTHHARNTNPSKETKVQIGPFRTSDYRRRVAQRRSRQHRFTRDRSENGRFSDTEPAQQEGSPTAAPTATWRGTHQGTSWTGQRTRACSSCGVLGDWPGAVRRTSSAASKKPSVLQRVSGVPQCSYSASRLRIL